MQEKKSVFRKVIPVLGAIIHCMSHRQQPHLQ